MANTSTSNDLRLTLAQEICEQFEMSIFPGRCDICSYPLLERSSEQMPFCWFCTCDRKTSHLGRTALLKAKLAEKGFIVDKLAELTVQPIYSNNILD